MKAVITGDIVNSTAIGDPGRLIRSVKYVLTSLDEQGLINRQCLKVFKGDSFQAVTETIEGLKVLLAIRSGLIGGIYRFSSPLSRDDMLGSACDARLSCGIGEVGEVAKDLNESFGEAFTFSGKGLEHLTKEGFGLLLTTPDEQLNEHFEAILRTVDILVSEWTENSAQAVFRKIVYDETQEEIAGFYGISQSSVHSRLKIAEIDQLEYLLEYYDKQIRRYGFN